jgi:hypothetical protein
MFFLHNLQRRVTLHPSEMQFREPLALPSWIYLSTGVRSWAQQPYNGRRSIRECSILRCRLVGNPEGTIQTSSAKGLASGQRLDRRASVPNGIGSSTASALPLNYTDRSFSRTTATQYALYSLTCQGFRSTSGPGACLSTARTVSLSPEPVVSW